MASKGFSLIEIILALALTSLVIFGVANGLLLTDRTLARLSGAVTARLLAEECAAVTRWVRDADGLESLPAGTHGLDAGGGVWTLSDGSDGDGAHVRELVVADVDAFQKDIECIITWDEDGRPASTSVVTRLSL